MNFTISTLESNTDGGVIVAHWSVSKTEGENVATSYGTVGFTPDASAAGYVAYDSLTDDTAIGRLPDASYTAELEASLYADLPEQAHLPVTVWPPW